MSILSSCDRIDKKGDDAIKRAKSNIYDAKRKIIDRKNKLVDEVFPSYDNGIPDTENNKMRFTEHLQVELTSDVKNIYAYGDFLGADYKVLISFKCDTSTIRKIVKAKSMTLSAKENDEGLFFGEEFTWWDKKILLRSKPYKIGKESEYWQYLWFDRKSMTAYYEEFSL